MTLPTCNTCRHWQHQEQSERGLCNSVTDRYFGASVTAERASAVIEYYAEEDAGNAYLMTAPAFGCVKHEPKADG